MVKCLEYGLNPLAVTWKTPVRTIVGQKNLDNLISLGVDHIDYQINPTAESKLLLKSFQKFGTPGLPQHLAIFNIPISIAVKFSNVGLFSIFQFSFYKKIIINIENLIWK